jgi:hypothetical protein
MEEKELAEYHLKGEFLMSSGLTIILEMKLTKSPGQSRFPMKDKFSWIACNKDNPQEEFILFDNHHKPPHFHIDSQAKFTFFAWTSRENAQLLFFEQVERKFGYFLIRTK